MLMMLGESPSYVNDQEAFRDPCYFSKKRPFALRDLYRLLGLRKTCLFNWVLHGPTVFVRIDRLPRLIRPSVTATRGTVDIFPSISTLILYDGQVRVSQPLRDKDGSAPREPSFSTAGAPKYHRRWEPLNKLSPLGIGSLLWAAWDYSRISTGTVKQPHELEGRMS